MLHEQRFLFLASKAIVFALSCVYGRSLFTGYFINFINPTVVAVVAASGAAGAGASESAGVEVSRAFDE